MEMKMHTLQNIWVGTQNFYYTENNGGQVYRGRLKPLVGCRGIALAAGGRLGGLGGKGSLKLTKTLNSKYIFCPFHTQKWLIRGHC